MRLLSLRLIVGLILGVTLVSLVFSWYQVREAKDDLRSDQIHLLQQDEHAAQVHHSGQNEQDMRYNGPSRPEGKIFEKDNKAEQQHAA